MANELRRTARGMRLAGELKRLRIQAGLSQKEVGAALGWTATKMSRLESAKVGADADDVAALLDLYGGVDSGQRAALLQLAINSKKRGWYAAYSDVFVGPYPGLEDEATRIRSYQADVVPGLLQTQRYMRASITGSPLTEPNERRIQARLARQGLLTRPTAPDIHFVISEAVLQWAIGGREVMREQLLALWDVAVKRSSVQIQVLPFSVGAHGGLAGSFEIFTLDEADDAQEIAYTEGPSGGVYMESQSELSDITRRWEDLLGKALSQDDSADFLARAADSSKE